MKVTLGSTCAHLANAGVAVALGTCMLIRLSYAHVQRLYQRRRLRASAAAALHLSSLCLRIVLQDWLLPPASGS